MNTPSSEELDDVWKRLARSADRGITVFRLSDAAELLVRLEYFRRSHRTSKWSCVGGTIEGRVFVGDRVDSLNTYRWERRDRLGFDRAVKMAVNDVRSYLAELVSESMSSLGDSSVAHTVRF